MQVRNKEVDDVSALVTVQSEWIPQQLMLTRGRQRSAVRPGLTGFSGTLICALAPLVSGATVTSLLNLFLSFIF